MLVLRQHREAELAAKTLQNSYVPKQPPYQQGLIDLHRARANDKNDIDCAICPLSRGNIACRRGKSAMCKQRPAYSHPALTPMLRLRLGSFRLRVGSQGVRTGGALPFVTLGPAPALHLGLCHRLRMATEPPRSAL